MRADQQINRAADECVGHVETDDVWRELPTRQARSSMCVALDHKLKIFLIPLHARRNGRWI